MYFLIEDNDSLEKAAIKKNLMASLSIIIFFLKTKVKSYGDEFTGFYDKETPKLDSNHTCLEVISLDSVLNKDENYYPQVFSKEFKYIEKKVIRYINDNLNDFSHSDKSDEEWLSLL